MRLILSSIFLLFITSSFNSNSEEVNIWIEQSHINKAIEFEQSLGNKLEFINMKISLSKSIYPLVDDYNIDQPVVIERSQSGYLPLSVEYFFSKEDSILRYISYDWERERYGNFFDKPNIWKQESKKLTEYNDEYERIKSTLISRIGEPVSQDEKPTLVKSKDEKRANFYERNTIWETEEYYSNLNLIFESMTYRIRWYYYWKK